MSGRSFAAALAAAATCLAACGGGSTGGAVSRRPTDPRAAIAAAYASTARAGSARMTLHEVIHTGARTAVSTGSGVLDFAHEASDVTLTTDGAPEETRTFDGTVYLHLAPDLQKQLGDGKPWIRTTQARESGGVTTRYSRGAGAAGGLWLLRLPPTAVVALGRDDVGTVEAARYQVTVDLAAAFAGQPAAGVKRVTDAYGGSTVTFTVWLDARDRVVRLVLPDTHKAGTFATTTDLTDFGTEVHVDTPPADQVGDDSKLPR